VILAVGFNPRISGVFDRPVASATIEPARRIDPIGVYYFFRLLSWLNRRYATGKYLAYNRGLKPTAKIIKPLRGGRKRAQMKNSSNDKI